jgi:hypothetical protein
MGRENSGYMAYTMVATAAPCTIGLGGPAIVCRPWWLRGCHLPRIQLRVADLLRRTHRRIQKADTLAGHPRTHRDAADTVRGLIRRGIGWSSCSASNFPRFATQNYLEWPFWSVIHLLLNFLAILDHYSGTASRFYGASSPIFSSIIAQMAAPLFYTLRNTSLSSCVRFDPRKRPCFARTKFRSPAYLGSTRLALRSPSDV